METQNTNQTEKPYIKLYKMKNYYNWEIKAYEDTSQETLTKLKEQLEEINNELQNSFTGE